MNTKCTDNVVVDQLKDINKRPEHKMAGVGIELVELEETFANEKEKHQQTINLLNSQIDTLKKEKDLKDEIIQNINAHFNTKVPDPNTKVEDLEVLKKDRLKTEKKNIKETKAEVVE